MNEDILIDYIKEFSYMIKNGKFVIDRTGVKCVELICEKISLNPEQKVLDFGIKKTNIDYCESELKWYDSMDLSIEDISKKAKLWKKVCDKNKNINSNYGWCIYSKENYYQFGNAIEELIKNNQSRRACMIYNRPSMQYEYNKDGMNDFMCTFATQQFIRNGKLIYIVMQRSCDFIYGFFNDFYWHCVVYERMLNRLKKEMNLDFGKIIYIANSLHVYEKHFSLIEKIMDNY